MIYILYIGNSEYLAQCKQVITDNLEEALRLYDELGARCLATL